MDKGVRSPNYPGVSLRDAIDRLRKLAGEIGQRSADRETVAVALGYSGLSGVSATLISALNKYELLDGRGDDIKVSDLAMAILYPSGEEEREAALRKAALAPALFRELHERFGNAQNDDLIRNYLLRNKFSPSAVDAAISSYRETIEFVGGLDLAHGSPRSEPVEPDMENLVTTPMKLVAPVVQDVTPSGFEDEKKSLDEGAATLRLPADLSPESVDDLEYWLEGVMRRLKRNARSAAAND